MRPSTRTSKTAAVAGVVGVLAVGGTALATEHDWPFSKASKPSSAQTRGAHQPGWSGPPEDQTRPAEEVWSGEVSLVLNLPYGLDEKPDKIVSPCGGCLMLEKRPGARLFLRAENGIVPWPKQERPSYYDCVHLRESGTLDYVSLEISPHDGGLAIHRWMCATGRNDDIVRLQYGGQAPDGKGYRFAVTTWYRPFVSTQK